MKKLALTLLAALLLTACGTAPAFPDTFHGVMSWEYTQAGGIQTASSPNGWASIEAKFENIDFPGEDQYYVSGTIKYIPDTWWCSTNPQIGSCEVTGTEDGIFIGSATKEGDLLTIKLSYPDSASTNIRPTEEVTLAFNTGGQGTQDSYALQTSFVSSGFLGQEWTIDLSTGAFVDDALADARTDGAYGGELYEASLSGTDLLGTGSGIFYLYRDAPPQVTTDENGNVITVPSS